MQVCNIFPVKNQNMYEGEEYVMILAHLLRKGLYNPEHFKNAKWIIMDNGLFEGEQVSTDLRDLIALADEWRAKGIHIDEIVIPDAMRDMAATKELYRQNFNTIKANPEYMFQLVVQHNAPEEFHEMMLFAGKYWLNNVTIGVPKLGVISRTSPEAIEEYKKALMPIHFLGLRETFEELAAVKDIVRSCDSAQVAIATKYHKDPASLFNWVRSKSEVIDLENDYIPEEQLKRMVDTQKGWYVYGIL